VLRSLLLPSRLVALGFAAAIAVGTVLLVVPWATETRESVGALTALFYATSAVCVTGLGTVDLPTVFSTYGEVVLLLLVQVGGIGIMTLTSLILLAVSRRLGLRTRLIAQVETGAIDPGSVRHVLVGVIKFSIAFELVIAVLIGVRLATAHDMSVGDAAWYGVFHSVTSFNNAGFALWSDSLVGFVDDWWLTLTFSGAIIAGGLGFPVWMELRREWRTPRWWSLHTKLTLSMTAALLVFGTIAVLLFEATKPGTLGPLAWPDKVLASFFASVTPRTAGFNTIDYSEAAGETLLVTDILMFVGAGSASTGGGIKVTTWAVLILMVVAEARGDRHVNAFDRRIPAHLQRQALVIAFLAMNAVVLATLGLMATSDVLLNQALFEAISAFGTVGLSTGITPSLDAVGQAILVALMFLGRTGPHTLAIALATRERERGYAYPEERPIIG
jgi:potassium uptake TrkH family protein